MSDAANESAIDHQMRDHGAVADRNTEVNPDNPNNPDGQVGQDDQGGKPAKKEESQGESMRTIIIALVVNLLVALIKAVAGVCPRQPG